MKLFHRNLLLISILVASGCAGNPNSGIANQCRSGLSTAYKELDLAKVEGFGGTVDYTKAASLLGAAKIQEEFGKYPNCVNKVQRARQYIKRSKR